MLLNLECVTINSVAKYRISVSLNLEQTLLIIIDVYLLYYRGLFLGTVFTM